MTHLFIVEDNLPIAKNEANYPSKMIKFAASQHIQKISSCITSHRIQFKNIALQHVVLRNVKEVCIQRLISDSSES